MGTLAEVGGGASITCGYISGIGTGDEQWVTD